MVVDEVVPCFPRKTRISVFDTSEERANGRALKSKSRVCFPKCFSEALVTLDWIRLQPSAMLFPALRDGSMQMVEL